MHLEHAILGFLNYGPFTGYELKRVFDRSIRHFWPADQSQIYKTLSKLSDKGLASMDIVHQDDRPSRKVYQITDAGRTQLMEWIRRTPEVEVVREPFLIQVFFAGLLPDEEAIQILEEKASEIRAYIENLNEVTKVGAQGDGQKAPKKLQFYWFLTVDHGLWMMQASLDWLEETIERIRRGEYVDGPAVLDPPRRRRDG